MKKLLLLILLIAATPAWAQYSKGILIILNDGDSVQTNYVGINNANTLFKGPHVQLDPNDKRQRISISEIKSIEGFDSRTQNYRYFRRLDGQFNNTLAERSIKSEHIEAYYYDSYHQSGMYGGGYSWRHLYYSKDGSALKKARFGNLKKDLADNPESLAYLKKVQSLRMAQVALYGAGIGLVVAAVSSLNNQPMGPGAEQVGIPNGLVLGVLGIAALRVPFFLNKPKQNHMTKALEAY